MNLFWEGFFFFTDYFTIAMSIISGNSIDPFASGAFTPQASDSWDSYPFQEAWSSKWKQQKGPSYNRQPHLRLPFPAQRQQGYRGRFHPTHLQLRNSWQPDLGIMCRFMYPLPQSTYSQYSIIWGTILTSLQPPMAVHKPWPLLICSLFLK